jgi:hypothetical protein
MEIEICKWKNGAQSAVVFMIDDFANAWVDKNNNGKVDKGEDWGFFRDEKNSMWDVLNNGILSNFPEVKATLFTVIGKRSPIIKGSPFTFSGSINDNDKFIQFIKKLNENERIELAYHGLTHGTPGEDRFDFIEEWEGFLNIEEANQTTQEGLEIFKKTLGKYPKGGKYCGYKFNNFSDKSIADSGFLWWCRHWDAALEELKDPLLSYELEIFQKKVVDIPSTIDGSFLSLKIIKKSLTKKYLKSLYMKFIKGKTLESTIEDRINRNQIISIQEHSSPFRTDNIIQYPNIISDYDNLLYIFNYLRKFNLWYATCTEVGEYFLLYNTTKIKFISEDIFIFTEVDERVKEKEITLSINSTSLKSMIKVKVNKETFEFHKVNNSFIGNVPVFLYEKYTIIL